MIWRDDVERARCCRAVLASVRLAHLWTYEGPTKQAIKYLRGSPLSHGEVIMLKLAWTLWNGAHVRNVHRYARSNSEWRFDLDEALGTLDSERWACVAECVAALASPSHERMHRFIEAAEMKIRATPIAAYRGIARGVRP